MDWFIAGFWWLTMGPLLAAELAISLPVGLVSGGLAYLDDGAPVYEPLWIVHGPRYYSSKLDYPLTDVSQWWYVGDEPENPPPRCRVVTEIDENSWTFKWEKMIETENLRGDETRGKMQPGGNY